MFPPGPPTVRRLSRRAALAVAGAAETTLLWPATVAARHYAMSGEIVRDVWYDPTHALARIALPGRDGVPIVFEQG